MPINSQPTAPQQAPAAQPAFAPQLMLCGVNTPTCATFLIDTPEFILGKQHDCNGVISFSNEISRHHAKILWRDGAYYIVDLDSANKTFVNGKALAPHIEKELRSGDRIALSTSVFQVEKIHR